jgi:hypothetical protein
LEFEKSSFLSASHSRENRGLKNPVETGKHPAQQAPVEKKPEKNLLRKPFAGGNAA